MKPANRNPFRTLLISFCIARHSRSTIHALAKRLGAMLLVWWFRQPAIGAITVLTILATVFFVAEAASATWSATPTNANWVAGGSDINWSTGVGTFPGSTSVITNGDTATFTGTSTELAITINSASLNIKNITFSGAAEPAYTVGTTGGNSLFLTNGGVIAIASGTTGANITNAVNAPLVLEPASSSTAGTYTFSNASSTASHPLVIGGTVTGGTTSQGIALTLQGGNTGSNVINGIISKGGAANVSVIKDASGTWTLSGANTFTGGVTIQQGILKAGSSTALGPAASATLTFGASSTGKFQLNGNNTTVIDLNTNATVGAPIIESGLGTAGTDTLTVNTTNTDIFAGVLQNGSTRLLALTKSGTGSLTLSGANTDTGITTISGGTLSLGASGVLADSSNINMNGGTFSTGATAGFTETIGTLALTNDSAIALGTGSHTLRFANSNGVTWTAGANLVITGWTGSIGSSGTSGQIFVGSDSTGLTPGQLAQIVFYDGTNTYTATILSTGEIVPAAPTAVKLTRFNAASFTDGVQLTWESGFEINNLGYRLYREQNGKRTRVTPSIVAGSTLLVGQGNRMTAGYSYSWFDPQGTPGTSYYLEAIDLDSSRQTYGPLYPYGGSRNGVSPRRERALLLNELGKSLANNSGSAATTGWPASMSAAARNESLKLEPQTLAAQQAIAGGKAVKLQVRQTSWYRVTQPELVAAGLDPTSDARLLQLYVDGEEVPVRLSAEGARLNANDTLEFYGVALDTQTTDTRTYWLVNGTSAGKRISAKRGKLKPGDQNWTDSPGLRSFAFTAERREKLIYSPRLLNGDGENIFGALVFSDPTEQTLQVKSLDREAVTPVQLEVALQGLTAQGHEVHIMLNGADLGRMTFGASAHSTATFAVNRALLREGDNTVSLASANGDSDMSFVDYVRLTYAHQYTADNNALRFSVPGGGVVRVDGFSTANIRVVDITDPNSPLELATAGSPAGAGYSIKVQAQGNGTRTLIAFADDVAAHPASITANIPSNWNASRNGADLVIITHKDFRQAIEPLATLRRNQGLSVAVVDVEDVYDEFSYGAHTPAAIKGFLLNAAGTWARKPGYLLLVGDSSWDPRNFMDQGANDFVPTKLIDTNYMETASDDWLVDFSGQGNAAMALGRLPGRTAGEVSLMVSKIMAYEQERELNVPLRGAVMVADSGFETQSAQTGALLPAGVSKQSINRATIGNDDLMRGQLLDALNQGPMIVNFYGHGSVGVWTAAGVLDSDLADTLTNSNRSSIYLMMTCLNGYAHDAYIDSLSESLLKAPNGGAVAVWASSGFTAPEPQFAMDSQFYRLLFGGQAMRLGEAARQAKLATSDRDVRRTWILLGDPTMRVR